MNELKKLLQSVIKNTYNLELEEINLETPPKKDMGDFAFGVFMLSKNLKQNPAIIASELAKNAELLGNDLILKLENVGPYLNIYLNSDIYFNSSLDLFKNSGLNLTKIGEGKSIVIDYIGANVGKPMHIGHMCTPNIGQVFVNIYKKLGYEVIADTHIGDWGIIFGKLITAYKLWGDKQKLEVNAVDYLLELYIKITAEIELEEKAGKTNLEEQTRNEFKLLSEGNSESIELWKEFTSYSIAGMQKQLDRLNIKPTFNIGESFYEGLKLPKLENFPDLTYSMTDIVEELISKGIATKNDDGSVGVVFSEESKIPSCMLRKRDGTHGYLASDLACIKYRKQNWNPEKIIYFVDVRQQLHLKQVFEIAKNAGWLENTNLFHAENGFISLKEGAMSTRHGRIIKLDKLLDEAETRALKIIEEKRDDFTQEEKNEIARIVGIGAIKYGYLKKSRDNDVIFDWDEFMSFEGNSGPFIQYAYVRSINVLKNNNWETLKNNEIVKDFELTQEDIDLIKTFGDFENVISETIKNHFPHILAKYAYELTKSFNALYNSTNILNELNQNLKIFRLNLVAKFSLQIKEVFELLGIEMPERM